MPYRSQTELRLFRNNLAHLTNFNLRQRRQSIILLRSYARAKNMKDSTRIFLTFGAGFCLGTHLGAYFLSSVLVVAMVLVLVTEVGSNKEL